jgi:hypothetical protein
MWHGALEQLLAPLWSYISVTYKPYCMVMVSPDDTVCEALSVQVPAPPVNVPQETI